MNKNKTFFLLFSTLIISLVIYFGLVNEGAAWEPSAEADGIVLEETPVPSAAGDSEKQEQMDRGDASSTTQTATPSAISQVERKSSVRLSVDVQSQFPELYNGCEVTSLSMMLDYAGFSTDKMVLADRVAKDTTPAVKVGGAYQKWGNPETGFVGEITGETPGYGVYHGPIAQLVERIMPGRSLDLTGSDFDSILEQVASGKPVVVWTTVQFAPTSDWVEWESPDGTVQATFKEHAVLLVGYDGDRLYINDPLDGTQSKAVDKSSFVQSWEQMGKQAVSYSG